MATTVITRSTCDRCGLQSERPGADADFPPHLWGYVRLMIRSNSKTGWTDHRETFSTLCIDCSEAVRIFLLTAPVS